MNKLIARAGIALLLTATLAAQTTQDPALAVAKEKLEVVYDLGRVFGYLHTMDKEQKKLALTATQVKSLMLIAEKIRTTPRLEPKPAEALLTEIELKILTGAQLTFVDDLAIARLSERTTAGTGAGNTGGVSPIQTYLNGGAFNPMLDVTKTLGKDYKAAVDYLKAKKW
ncbi:MAG: hypothetical protein WCG80_02740 [Spirochaetales bacterium]